MLADRKHFRFVTLLFGALFTYAVALIFGLPALYFFCACLLVLPAVSYLLAAWGLRAIRGERRVPSRLWPGEKADVELRLHLEALMPKCLLRIDESLPVGLAEDPDHPAGCVVPMLWSDTHIHRYPVIATHRGLYRLPPLRCTAVDTFDLFSASCDIGPADEILVYPRTVTLRDHALWDASRSGEVRRRKPTADGTDFRATREYRPGDPLRRIHWRSTARRGTPIVMEFEEPASLDMMVVLDCSGAGVVGTGRDTNFEAGVTLAASLVRFELERDNAIGLWVDTADGTVHHALTDERLRMLAFFETLARLEPTCPRPFAESLTAAAEELPPSVQLVAVSADTSAAVAEALGRLFGRGHPTAFCWLDPAGYAGANGATDFGAVAGTRQFGAGLFRVRAGRLADSVAEPVR